MHRDFRNSLREMEHLSELVAQRRVFLVATATVSQRRTCAVLCTVVSGPWPSSSIRTRTG
jgi:hypothetical protein